MKAMLLLMAVSVVSLTGCEINRVGKFAGIDIQAKADDGGDHHHESDDGQGFCPYGQAKKGHCRH